MFIVYSKLNGKIKNVAIGGNYKTIKDLFPYDYEDYDLIYNCMNVEDDIFIANNFESFKVTDGKIVVDDEELKNHL